MWVWLVTYFLLVLSGLLWWGVGGVLVGSFLQVFFMHFTETDCFPGFYVDRYPCGEVLIITWRQILNCAMTRGSMHIEEREGEYTYACVHICVLTDMYVCVHMVVHMCFCAHASIISVAFNNCMHMCIFMCRCEPMYIHICVNACMCDVYVYMYVYMCECMYVCLYICL